MAPEYPSAPPIVRVRANEALLPSIARSDARDNGGRVTLPGRYARLHDGQRIRVEFGFGALADEIVVDAHVELSHADGEVSTVVAVVVPEHRERIEYVHDVLAGAREPVVRRYPRVPMRTTVRWHDGDHAHSTFTGDISAGGVFIVGDRTPPMNTIVSVELEPIPGLRIETDARVAWLGRARQERGFGVEFQGLDPEAKVAIGNAVRARLA